MGYGYGQSCLHPLVANDLHFELHRNRYLTASFADAISIYLLALYLDVDY
jgi:hypothetical protein